MKLKISGARISFPVLFTPEAFQGEGAEAYGCSLLIGPKKDIEVLQGELVEGGGMRYVKKIKLNEAIEQVGQEKWLAKWPTVKKNIAAKDLTCLHDGNTKTYVGYADNYYVQCRAQVSARPAVMDARGAPVTERDGVIYGGCYVIALIELWAQDNKFGQRINAQIRGVQFLRSGDAFGGGAPAQAGEFDDVSEGADAEDIS